MFDLKPCPFCGGKATLCFRTYKLSPEAYIVYCEECDAQGQPCGTEDKAAKAWNKRTNDDHD